MQYNDKKFFEELAHQHNPARDHHEEGSLHVELAKTGGVMGKPKVVPKRNLAEARFVEGEEAEGQLTIDVYQTPDDIVVESAVAGVDPEDIDINVTNDSITIRGHRKREREISEDDYFYQECYWGRFSRSVILPQEVDPENARAVFSKNGILTVYLPKVNRQRARKLKVKFE